MNWTLPPHLIVPTIMAFDTAMTLPWHITDYGIDKKIWPKTEGDGVRLGIVDTGVSPFHASQGDLSGAIADARDFSGSRFGWEDHNGHGTHVAGIAGSRTFGVAPRAELVIAKALGDGGAGSDASVANAIDFCAKRGCKVINLSLGSDTDSPTILGKIAELAQQGVIVVAAAGNSGGGVNSPGRSEHVICDAAIDRNGVVASFSCHGKQVDVCAPGVDILSLGLKQSMVQMSGTSMSSPWISGILSCLLSYQVKNKLPVLASVDEAISYLTKASTDLGLPGTDEFYGVGLPDADKIFGVNGEKPRGPVPLKAVITLSNGETYEFSEAKLL